MPHALVKYDPAKLVLSGDFRAVTDAVCIDGATQLSCPTPEIEGVSALVLEPDDIFPIFLPKGPNVTMRFDVEVLMWAHSFVDRLGRLDTIAENIQKALVARLNSQLTASVSVMLVPIGYYAGHEKPRMALSGWVSDTTYRAHPNDRPW